MATESYPKQWKNKEWVGDYLEIADLIVVGRGRSLRILRSFYRYFLMDKKPNTVLDLGCGDGILTHELLTIDDSISAVLVDGSWDMLTKARERLTGLCQAQFIKASFQELFSASIELPTCDFAVSSLAIHHLTSSEKKSLFRYLFSHLNDGGYFANIDVVCSSAESVERWYRELWKEDVLEQRPSPEIEEIFAKMFRQYIEMEHYDKVDSLEDQMRALAEAGFRDVDCFYKRGMFAMYGGRR